jgi:Rps23 Pro-64 3,4-dihydroxylase Tpa1-like proline 4-hydroxylase
MPPSRTRSPSPEGPAKRQKLDDDVKANFHPSIFDSELAETQAKEYQGSAPFKHCQINALFQDDLLENVKDECIRELAFTEKETDIYKVNSIRLVSRIHLFGAGFSNR